MEGDNPTKPIYPRPHRKASQKQITALKLVAEGMPTGKAMIQAGYSPKSARNPKQVLLTSHAITNAVDEMRLELTTVGLTVPYLVKKIKTWIDDDDARVGMTAYDKIAPVLGLVNPQQSGLKRKVTLEEFLDPTQKIQDMDTSGSIASE